MNKIITSKFVPWEVEIDGNDLVVKNIKATCFGGKYDKGDNGETESGVKNDGSNNICQCALPIRSIEKATKNSPLAFKGPHIPWKTIVKVWHSSQKESEALITYLTDNGPDISKYPDHALDLNPESVLHFIPNVTKQNREKILKEVANKWSSNNMNFRIINGAKYIS